MTIELQGISVQFERIPVLKNCSLSIKPGDFYVLSGPTGSGKTSLLRLLYCDLQPSSGSIFINGQDTKTFRKSLFKKIRKKIGISFQDSKLLSDLTVFENISLPIISDGLEKKEVNSRVLEAVTALNLSFLRNKYPHQLSGGEKHLVSLARASARKPEILIADEPSGNLDFATTKLVAELIMQHVTSDTSVIVSTHSDELISMLPGATIIEIVDSELVLRSVQTSLVDSFLGKQALQDNPIDSQNYNVNKVIADKANVLGIEENPQEQNTQQNEELNEEVINAKLIDFSPSVDDHHIEVSPLEIVESDVSEEVNSNNENNIANAASAKIIEIRSLEFDNKSSDVDSILPNETNKE